MSIYCHKELVIRFIASVRVSELKQKPRASVWNMSGLVFTTLTGTLPLNCWHRWISRSDLCVWITKKSSHGDDRAVIILQVLSHSSTLTGEFPRFLHSLNPAVSAGQRHVTPGPVRQGLFGESNKVYKCFIKFCGQFRRNRSKCSECSKKYPKCYCHCAQN